MRKLMISLSLIVCLVVCASLASAAGKGPKEKLPAPANVTCPLIGTDVVVSWDLVADAAAYQVEHTGAVVDGSLLEDSDFVLGPPVAIPVDDFTSMTIHVRGMPAPKHPGGPVQAGAPKGLWSDPCVVVIP